MSTPEDKIEKHLAITEEDMKTLSREELLDKAGKMFAGKVFFRRAYEDAMIWAAHMEATWIEE